MDPLLKNFPRCLLAAAMWITLGSTKEHDICSYETIHPTCGDAEVIQMEQAKYGRMSVGRCAPDDLGYIGCKVNVLEYLESICSGRQTCQISPLDRQLMSGYQPCRRGLETYLQIQYSCVQVYVPATPCGDKPIEVLGRKGLLANFITERTGKGSEECPWQLRASEGQKIRLTLHDFGVWTPPMSQGAGSEDHVNGSRLPDTSDNCHLYASIKDPTTQGIVRVCGGEAREKIVYTSGTESLLIYVNNHKHSRFQSYFLLQYEVVGCPTYNPPEGAVIDKHENEISVRCPDSRNKWLVSCDGTKWKATGQVTKCNVPGIMVILIISIAVLIAVIILVFGAISLRRKRNAAIEFMTNPLMNSENLTSLSEYSAKNNVHIPMTTQAQQSQLGREYTCTPRGQVAVPGGAFLTDGELMSLHLPPTTPYPDSCNCFLHDSSRNEIPARKSNNTYRPPYTEHLFDSPNFLWRSCSESHTTEPFYNELDPEFTGVGIISGTRRVHKDCDNVIFRPDTPVASIPEAVSP